METPFLFPVEPNDFYLRLKQLIDKALSEKLSQIPLVPPPNGMTSKPLLSLKEVCDLFQITKPTVYEWIGLKTLRPVKIRGRVYFLLSDIQNLIRPNEA